VTVNFIRKLFGSPKPKAPAPEPRREHRSKEEIVEHLLGVLAPFKRTAYIPTTESSANAFSTHSKFGGFPYLSHPGDWPTCPNCHHHLQLFLQLNLSALPVNKEEGLIQLFYCTNEEPHCASDCEAFFPFSRSVVCRKVPIGAPSCRIEPDLGTVFEEKRITGWSPVDDYPHYEELAALGLDIDADDYEVLEIADVGTPRAGDKLYGWPYWVQDIEYPNDRKTGSRMELLFQLDSEVNLPYMFGDAGIGHLTQSKDNPGELAFGWACT
jgi:hypothetical protein